MFSFSFSIASSSWWDSNWEYRKAITVTDSSGSDLVDFQVPIDITDALYDNTGLVGSWHFSEGGGSRARDSSGNGNDGTLVNGPAWTTGKFGSGLEFGGAGSYVGVLDSGSLDVVDAVSVEAWVELPETAGPLGSPENPWLSCSHILENGGSTGDGVYSIDLDGAEGNAAFDAYCDMTTDGGGWTLVLNTASGGKGWDSIKAADSQFNACLLSGDYCGDSSTGWQTADIKGASYMKKTQDGYASTNIIAVFDSEVSWKNMAVIGSGSGARNLDGGVAGSYFTGTYAISDESRTLTDGYGSDGSNASGCQNCAWDYAFALANGNSCGSTRNSLLSSADGSLAAYTHIYPSNYYPTKIMVFVRSSDSSFLSGEISKGGAYGLSFDESFRGRINDQIISVSSSAGWNHVVLTYDRNAPSDQQKLYVNGVLEAQGTLTESIDVSSNDLSVGNFKGKIDEVRIFNRALSQTEIQDRFDASKARLDLGDLRFADAIGNPISHWLENDNKVWVKVPGIPANGSTGIYMYYGNSSAGFADSFDGVFTKDFGDTDLLGLWHFDDSVSPTSDSSASANDAVVVGATWSGSDGGQWGGRSDVKFSNGNSLIFDGNDYADTTKGVTIAGNAKISFEAWVKFNSSGLTEGIFGHCNDPNSSCNGTDYDGILVRKFSTDKLHFGMYYHRSGGGYCGYLTSNPVPINQWVHIAVVYDSLSNDSGVKMYVDGVSVPRTRTCTGSAKTITFYPSIGSFVWGNNTISGHSAFMNGNMDDVRLYNRALSADEIKAHYERRKNVLSQPTQVLGVQEQSDTPFITGIVFSPAAPEEGQQVTVTVDAADSQGIETITGYTFTIKRPDSGVFVGPVTQSGNQYSFTPDVAGSWTVEVTATDTEVNISSVYAEQFTVSGWWDSGWKYRKPVTVTDSSGSDLADFQIPIDLTDAIYDNTGLVGSWHFSKGTGTRAVDFSGNGNDGTLTNGPVWATGKFGFGLEFDGADDFVSVSNSDSLAVSNQITIEAWVKFDSLAHQYVVGKTNAGCTENGYGLALDPNGKFELVLWGGSNTTGIRAAPGGQLAQAGVWYHLVGVADTENSYFYVNGVLDRSASGSAPTSIGSSPMYIGKTGCGYPVNGLIDEVRIYNRALSETEVQDHFNASKARLDLADLRFSDVSGTQELPYWLENDSKVWVKVPSIPANGSTDIYMYYGNPVAESASSGDGTFDFFDNFDDGIVSDWSQSNYYLTVASSFSADSSYCKSPDYSFKIYNKGNCYSAPYSGGETRMSKTVLLSNGGYVADFSQKVYSGKWGYCGNGGTSYGGDLYVYADDVRIFTRNCRTGSRNCISVTCESENSTSGSFVVSGESTKISLSARPVDCSYSTSWFDDVRLRKSVSSDPVLVLGGEAQFGAPVVTGIILNSASFEVGDPVTATATATDPNEDPITDYDFRVLDGLGNEVLNPAAQSSDTYLFDAVGEPGLFQVKVKASDGEYWGPESAKEVFVNDSSLATLGLSLVNGTFVNTELSEGKVVLSGTQSSGTFTTPAIEPVNFSKWGIVTFSKTTPGNSTLTVDVLDASDDSVLIAGVKDGQNISGLGAAAIKLRANFTSGSFPSLDSWNVSYYTQFKITITNCSASYSGDVTATATRVSDSAEFGEFTGTNGQVMVEVLPGTYNIQACITESGKCSWKYNVELA